MPNLPTLDSLVREVSREFVKPLRRNLTGFRLFAGKETRTGSWARETLQWFETTELADVVVSMDLPPVQADDMTLTPKSIGIPLLTKDLIFQGRKGAQIEELGLDTVMIDSQARAMAVEMERALLLGYPANSGGPTTGLFNDANLVAHGGMGALTTGTAEDINDAIAGIIQTAVTNEFDGPYALAVPRADVKIFQKFINGTSVRIGDNLPGALEGSLGGIQAILPTTHLTSGNLRLIDLSPGNYDAVSPRNEGDLRWGIGAATVGEVARSTLLTGRNEIMMSRTVRALNAVVPRVIRPKAVTSGTYT